MSTSADDNARWGRRGRLPPTVQYEDVRIAGILTYMS